MLARPPPYQTAFRLFSNRVVLGAPLTGDAAQDAALLLDGLRNGRAYTVIDALAGSYSFEFTAQSGFRRLARLDFSAGKFPLPRELSCRIPLANEQPVFLLQ